ncbi:MAG: maleylpyruvate isomerase family mycothiol-dependent enzyme, partial [Acidimicrobiales bacterium]
WNAVASGEAAGPRDVTEPPRPPDEEIIDWFLSGAERLANTLDSQDDEVEVWTWSSDHSMGFIKRRMAHETAVHCWDTQKAAGRPEPLPSDLAADGIDEFLGVFLPRRDEHLAGPSQHIHLHCTDEAGEWLIGIGEGAIDVERAHGKAPAAVRASASDLVLMLWRRVGPEDLEVLGDRDELTRFLARAGLG